MNKAIWQPPTRRAFVALLGLGAVAIAVLKPKKPGNSQPTTDAPVQPMLWIGHC